MILLYREDYYDRDKARAEGREHVLTLIVAKHWSGPTGDVEVFLDEQHPRVLPLDRAHE